MPNGAVNHPSGDGIIICAQGNLTPGTGGIFHMPRHTPPRPIITNVGGRELNAPNDVVVARDGAVWFTDPCYGADQDFRRRPQLPNAVWRFDEKTGDVRMVADGLGRPNGIAFSPDESVCYITDTDTARGAPPNDPTRASTIYAYDVVNYHGSPFLANKRVFAFVSNGFPDGIKCDLDGNVYSGVGDGVAVWSPAGVRLGTIATGSWVANFSFGRKGEMFICNETRLWRVQLGGELRGALLGV
jgi:gluconolactonase